MIDELAPDRPRYDLDALLREASRQLRNMNQPDTSLNRYILIPKLWREMLAAARRSRHVPTSSSAAAAARPDDPPPDGAE